MASQGVAPNHVGILFKVCAQDDFHLRVLSCASLNRLNQELGIIESHLPELSIAATITIEGNAAKKGPAIFIDVEVSKDTVFLEA